jgi:hypothetical protein
MVTLLATVGKLKAEVARMALGWGGMNSALLARFYFSL